MELCNEIIGRLADLFIPNCKDETSKVFFYKMKGDYHRYEAETAS